MQLHAKKKDEKKNTTKTKTTTTTQPARIPSTAVAKDVTHHTLPMLAICRTTKRSKVTCSRTSGRCTLTATWHEKRRSSAIMSHMLLSQHAWQHVQWLYYQILQHMYIYIYIYSCYIYMYIYIMYIIHHRCFYLHKENIFVIYYMYSFMIVYI